jgi:uncharacterized protein (TIGR00251 family)
LTVKSRKDNEEIRLKVTPGASRNEIVGFIDGVLQVKIAAPPVRGKANQELTSFLSRTLGVSKSALSIVRGHTSRNKVITIEGMTLDDIIKLFNA